MKYRRGDMSPWLNGPHCRNLVSTVTVRKLIIMRNLVGKKSRDTVVSGRMSVDKGGKGDRWRGVITFGGNALAEQFGNRRRRPSRFMTRAMEVDE